MRITIKQRKALQMALYHAEKARDLLGKSTTEARVELSEAINGLAHFLVYSGKRSDYEPYVAPEARP